MEQTKTNSRNAARTNSALLGPSRRNTDQTMLTHIWSSTQDTLFSFISQEVKADDVRIQPYQEMQIHILCSRFENDSFPHILQGQLSFLHGPAWKSKISIQYNAAMQKWAILWLLGWPSARAVAYTNSWNFTILNLQNSTSQWTCTL
jgi:hypothetical protein